MFGEPTPGLYLAIRNMKRVLVRSRVSHFHSLAFVPANQVFSEAMVLFATESDGVFGVLQSTIHEVWARQYASSLETRMRYTPSDCLETFPCPIAIKEQLAQVGHRYHSARSKWMLDRQEGLTATYNHFHDTDESSADIQKLRELHVEMDQAVTAAYGWTDLELGHDFHETKQGVRFTISETARREILQRLLKLNHERYAEEVKQGLHEKKGAGRKAAPKKKTPDKPARREASLFGEEDDE